jgi:hypothetical protein
VTDAMVVQIGQASVLAPRFNSPKGGMLNQSGGLLMDTATAPISVPSIAANAMTRIIFLRPLLE